MGILALKCTSTHGFHQKFKSLLRAIDLTLLMYVEEQCNHWLTNLPSSWLSLKLGRIFCMQKIRNFCRNFKMNWTNFDEQISSLNLPDIYFVLIPQSSEQRSNSNISKMAHYIKESKMKFRNYVAILFLRCFHVRSW